MITPSLTITPQIREQIIHLLRKSGVPSNQRGYDYLKSALELILEDPSYLKSVTSRLYPTVADIHDTEPSRVERSIRHAVESVYNRNDPFTLEEWLGRPDLNKDKLTNSEFLATMAENIRLSNGCYSEGISEAVKELEAQKRRQQLMQDLIYLGVVKGEEVEG